MTNIKYLKFFFFISLIAIYSCKSKTEKSVKPNFLFIVVDDLGYHDLSSMGSKYYQTPNIDRVINEGRNFTSGYATCAVCSPSRASLLTGKFTARHGITEYVSGRLGTEWRRNERHTKLLPPMSGLYLNHDEITLPEALKENGYTTFFAGKWHLGSKEENSLPTDHGFDINMGGYEKGGPYSGGYFSPFNNPQMTDYEDEKGMSLSMKLAKETSTFISQHKDTQFLAYLSFYAVHSPIQTSKKKWKKYRNRADSMGIHKNGFEMERVLPIRKYQDNPVYGGLVEQVDDAIGNVLETLKKLNLDKNTVVIFTSDNGGVASGDNFSTSNLPLRGGKGYQWEGGIKVPYSVYVPWINKNGTKTDIPVTGADLYPTILELAGVPFKPKQHADGVSLVPVLKGETIQSRPLFWHYPHYGNQGGEPHSIIREDDWKLIHYWEDNRNELYDLKKDVGERNDLSIIKPNITSKMSKRLLNWLTEMDAKYPEIDSLRNEEATALVLESYKTELLPKLEKKREAMLSSDWEPNKDWWGSNPTEQ